MIHEFCDHCEGCRPALIDVATGQVFAQDSPLMRRVNRIWDKETTYAERKAFIAVTLHNSRNLRDLELTRAIVTKIEAANREAP